MLAPELLSKKMNAPLLNQVFDHTVINAKIPSYKVKIMTDCLIHGFCSFLFPDSV